MSRIFSTLAGAVALLLAALPAAGQGTLVIQGGTVHPLSGAPFTGSVLVVDGVITEAGPSVAAPSGATVVDAVGLHVYPGLFDAASVLGLTEIGSVDVTEDIDELGDFTPHLQTRTAVHPASELIPVARADGITHTMAVPLSGGGFRGGPSGGFSGQGSVFHLDGWTIEEMDIAPSAVMAMEWPGIRTREFDRTTFSWRDRPYREAREEQQEMVSRMREWLAMARGYQRGIEAGTVARPDQRLAALARVTSGEIPVLARVETERDIRDVVEFAQEEGLRLIVAGASQGYRVADLLARHRVPVILGPTQSNPTSADAPYDEQYRNPGALHAAGVDIAFATFDAADSRTLAVEAAAGVPYGLPRDAALRAITSTPAEILGLGDRLGTIEPGKVANLIVTDGDPLEIRTSVVHLIVDGRRVDLANRHSDLYERYRSRPLPVR